MCLVKVSFYLHFFSIIDKGTNTWISVGVDTELFYSTFLEVPLEDIQAKLRSEKQVKAPTKQQRAKVQGSGWQ